MRKRIGAAILLCLVSLCGCVWQEQRTAVGICYRNRNESFLAKDLEKALTDAGFAVMWEDALDSQAKQDDQLGELLEKGCQLIFVDPVMMTTADSVVNRMYQADIPVVFFGRQPPDAVMNLWNKAVYVGCDRRASGSVLGNMVLELPRQGDADGDGVVSYLMLRGPLEDVDAGEWAGECMRAVEASGIDSQCVKVCPCEWKQKSGRMYCEQQLLNKEQPLDVIFCCGNELTAGALQAVLADGRIPGKDVYLIALDGKRALFEQMKRGAVSAVVWEDSQGQAEWLVKTANALMQGKPVDKYRYVDHITIVGEKKVGK